MIPNEVLENRERNILLVQCIEEAIANAVRHSKANSVKVTAQLLENQQVRLSIINNGGTFEDDGIGMGTAWLDHHAPNGWNRRVTDDGAELVVTL